MMEQVVHVHGSGRNESVLVFLRVRKEQVLGWRKGWPSVIRRCYLMWCWEGSKGM